MRIVSTIGTSSVVHDGTTYSAESDGTFVVPEEIGRELTGFPIWLEEWQAQERDRAAQRETDTNADRQAERIRALEEQVAELRELVVKPKRVRRTKAEIEADAATEIEADDVADDE